MRDKLLHSILVGIIAGVAVWSAATFNLTGWILFMAWISYFLFGPTLRSNAWAFAQMIVGVLLSLLVIQSSMALAPLIGIWGNVGVVILLVAVLGLLEDVQPINVLPAYYIGLVIFIATGLPPVPASLWLVIPPILAGFAFGWATVASRGLLARSLAGRSDAIPSNSVADASFQ